MVKSTISPTVKTPVAKAETTMEKTTRIARFMIDEEAGGRAYKNARRLKARLEREANTPLSASVNATVNTSVNTSVKTPKKRSIKTEKTP